MMLFLLWLVAGQVADWTNVKTVTVVMVDDEFQPDHLTFEHEVPVRLHLENRGKELHEFTAPEFFADAVVRNAKLLSEDGKEVVVQPGQSVDVLLQPIKAGTFRLYCADHDWDAMVGEIVVK